MRLALVYGKGGSLQTIVLMAMIVRQRRPPAFRPDGQVKLLHLWPGQTPPAA
jgi:hypothetical protein